MLLGLIDLAQSFPCYYLQSARIHCVCLIRESSDFQSEQVFEVTDSSLYPFFDISKIKLAIEWVEAFEWLLMLGV